MLVLLTALSVAPASPPALSGRGPAGLNLPSPPSTAPAARPDASPWASRYLCSWPATELESEPTPAPRRASRPAQPTAWQLKPDRIENPGEVILFADLPSGLTPIPQAANHLPVDPTQAEPSKSAPEADPAPSAP